MLHRDFRWNGNGFASAEDLLLYAEQEDFETFSFLRDWMDEKCSIKVHTSGSTGIPKHFKLRKEQMIHSAQATGAYFGLGAGSSALNCLPIKYIAGKMMLVRAMVLGWQLDSITPSTRLDIAGGTTYDFVAMVPLQVSRNLDQIGKIGILLVGGGEMPEALEQSLTGVSTQVFASYGMTETITHIALRPVNPAAGGGGQDAYQALPGVKFTIDPRGCLVIRAPGVSTGLVITNDLVELISDTQFHWLGRFDNIVNSGGIKLFPEHLEKQLKPMIRSRFFLAGEKDESLGERLVLVIEGQAQAGLANELRQSQLSGALDLPSYALPKRIYFTERFLETETGKIQRNKTLDLIRSKGFSL